jgi:hypothetical protein
VHPVNAAILSRGAGKYRCGKCNKIGNALEALFDEWPQASQQGTPPGDIPELGFNLSLDPSDESPAPDEAALPTEPELDEETDSTPGMPRQRLLWLIGTVGLAGIITLNLLRFFQQPLIEQERPQSTLVRLGLKQAPPEPEFRALDQIALLNRDLKTHPLRPGILVLTATIANLADLRQPYPDVVVTLLDIHNQQLANHLFKPGDYLSHSSELRSGMSPQSRLSFSLELPDPGVGATGFEMQFR